MTLPPLPATKGRLRWLEPVDRVHAGFYLFVLIVAVVEWPTLHPAWMPFAWYGGALAATVGLALMLRGRSGLRASVPRLAFTLVVAPFSFLMLSTVVPAHSFHGERLLYDVDTAMFFGTNPNVALDRLAWPPLTELLQWVYAFYYLIPFVMWVVFFKEGRTGAISRGLFTMLLCLYLSYVGYFLIPATGPNINLQGLFPAHFRDPMPGVFLAEKLRASTLEAEWIKHDCWPSGHTALSLTCLVLARREGSKAFHILLAPVLLLIFSTMYLRYHYVTDVLFGVALAWLVLRYGPPMHARFYGAGSPELEA